MSLLYLLLFGFVWSMPYADPADYRESHAARYSEVYRKDWKFRNDEALRKANWYAERANDPAWLAEQAAKKRAARAAAKMRG